MDCSNGPGKNGVPKNIYLRGYGLPYARPILTTLPQIQITEIYCTLVSPAIKTGRQCFLRHGFVLRLQKRLVVKYSTWKKITMFHKPTVIYEST